MSFDPNNKLGLGTTSLPVGLPGQVLTTDFVNESLNGISWKNATSPASSGILTQNTNTTAKYTEVFDTSLGIAIPPSGVDIPFNRQRRLDSIFQQSVDTTEIVVNDIGTYIGSYRIGIGYASDAQNTAPAMVKSVLLLDQADGLGYLPVSGTSSYATLDFGLGGEAKTNLTVQFVVVLTNLGSKFKIHASEYLTTTGVVTTKPQLSNFSLLKVIIQDPTGISSQQFFAYNQSSLTYSITSTYTTVILDSIGIGNPSSSFSNTNNFLQISQSQNYYISANLGFQVANCPDGTTITIEGRITRKFSAGTLDFIEVPGSKFCSTFQVTAALPVMYECISNGIYLPLVSGDALLYQVRIRGTPPLSGVVSFINSACNVTGVSVYSPVTSSIIRDFSGYTDLPKQLSMVGYTDVPITTEIVKHSSILHQPSSGIVQVGENGTYVVMGSITVQNTGTVPCLFYSNLMVDSGNGFTYTEGSQSLTCIYPGGSETIFQTLVMYLGYNFQIKMRCLPANPSGVSLVVTAELDNANLVLFKFEKTLALIIPTVNSFGNYYSRAIDADLLMTTVTNFMPRLTLTSTSVPFGQFRLFFSLSWSLTNVSVPFQMKIVMDGTTEIYFINQTAIVSNYFQNENGVYHLDLLAGVHTFVMYIATSGIENPCMTKNACMEIWKVID